jgi:hypothetical protein
LFGILEVGTLFFKDIHYESIASGDGEYPFLGVRVKLITLKGLNFIDYYSIVSESQNELHVNNIQINWIV